MLETIEVIIHRWVRTVQNMRNANQLAEDLDNMKAFCDGLISSHRIELMNLRSTYAAQQSEDRALVDRNDGGR
jgi:hypothetical protein